MTVSGPRTVFNMSATRPRHRPRRRILPVRLSGYSSSLVKSRQKTAPRPRGHSTSGCGPCIAKPDNDPPCWQPPPPPRHTGLQRLATMALGLPARRCTASRPRLDLLLNSSQLSGVLVPVSPVSASWHGPREMPPSRNASLQRIAAAGLPSRELESPKTAPWRTGSR